jgi:ankyrin repeat protein
VTQEKKGIDYFNYLVGADPNKGDSRGWAPLINAVRQNDMKNIEAVLNNNKVDPKVRDGDGKSIIHHVVNPREFGSFENEELLKKLSTYCDINLKDKQGNAPVFYA